MVTNELKLIIIKLLLLKLIIKLKVYFLRKVYLVASLN